MRKQANQGIRKIHEAREISGEAIRETIVRQRLDSEEKYETWRKAHPRAKLPSARAVRNAWANADRTWKFMLATEVR